MNLKIPDTECHWNNKGNDDLGDCSFQVFFTKIDEATQECGGSPRKQTKQETLVEGLKLVHNAQASANLVGSKFIISRSGQPLHVTNLPVNVLRKFGLPEEYADVVGEGGNTPLATDPASSGFGGFSDSAPSAPNEDKRIALAAKCMFLQLAASLDIIYAHESEDLYIAEVKAKPNPTSIVEAVFDSGEHFDGPGTEAFVISFGLMKQVEA